MSAACGPYRPFPTFMRAGGAQSKCHAGWRGSRSPRGAGSLPPLLFIISLQIAPFVPKHSASCANMSSDSMDIYPKQSQSSTCTYGYLSEGTREPKNLIPRLELGCFTLSNSLAKQNSVQKDFTSGLG